MKNRYFIILMILLIAIYVFIINVVAEIMVAPKSLDFIGGEGGNGQRIAIGSSVSILHTGNRWYGKLLGYDGNYRLYLCHAIPLPLNYGETNFIYSHLVFLAILILIVFFKIRKGG